MSVSISKYIIGPLENNTYLIEDEANGVCAIIDPAAPKNELKQTIEKKGLSIQYFLITHAHFDHVGGIRWFQSLLPDEVPVALHPDDLPLWKKGGGAREFGFEFDPGCEPSILLRDNQLLTIGQIKLKVLHTPGHSPGHVVFYEESQKAVFCGDLIFYHGVGRTDLFMSSSDALKESIRNKVFTLDPDTRLLPGHGPETTVHEEIQNNPYI